MTPGREAKDDCMSTRDSLCVRAEGTTNYQRHEFDSADSSRIAMLNGS